MNHGIPLDKAELLSVILEALLYGFSLLMFGATIWTLIYRRSMDRVNHKMFAVACALLLLSTSHIVIHIIRVMDGFLLYQGINGGPAAYFADITQWTFNAKNYIYIVQMLVGDGVMLYRCYVVWQPKYIMILPVLLWCAAGLTGFMSCYNSQISNHPGVFQGAVEEWITSFWASSLTTNLVTTLLLVGRLWYVDRRTARMRTHQRSPLRPVLRTIIDAGAIYTFTLFVELLCFLSRSNAQYVLLDMVTPIISITFYMVIIRIGLVTHANGSTSIRIGNSMDQSMVGDRRRRMQVHITTLTKSKLEDEPPRPMSLMNPSTGKSSTSDSDGAEAYRVDKHDDDVHV